MLFKVAKRESAKQIVEEIQFGKMSFDRAQDEDEEGDGDGGGAATSDAASVLERAGGEPDAASDSTEEESSDEDEAEGLDAVVSWRHAVVRFDQASSPGC